MLKGLALASILGRVLQQNAENDWAQVRLLPALEAGWAQLGCAQTCAPTHMRPPGAAALRPALPAAPHMIFTHRLSLPACLPSQGGGPWLPWLLRLVLGHAFIALASCLGFPVFLPWLSMALIVQQWILYMACGALVAGIVGRATGAMSVYTFVAIVLAFVGTCATIFLWILVSCADKDLTSRQDALQELERYQGAAEHLQRETAAAAEASEQPPERLLPELHAFAGIFLDVLARARARLQGILDRMRRWF